MEPYLNRDPELEKKVLDLLNEVTKSKYTSSLEINHSDGMYFLRLGLNCKDASPIALGFAGDEEAFLKWLRKEFKTRRLQDVRYTKAGLENGNSDMLYPIIEI
jgi:hypothetical protein